MAAISRLGVVSPPALCRRIGVLASRAYGSSSAQLQYDDSDYYCDEEEEYHRRSPPSMEDSDGWVPRRGVQWVVMGGPGAKKHEYAERLSKLLEVPHISMGSLVRQELDPSSSLFKQIANAVNGGKLVPEEIIFGLLSKRLEEGYCRGESGFILDGIPRTRIQAEILDQIADIDLVVNLKSTEENWVKKNLGSGIFSPLQEFHSMSHRQNLDVQMQEWKAKLNTYSEQSKPLEEYYKRRNILFDFQVAGAPAETWKGLLAALKLQHVDALHSSQKLTA